MYSQQLKAEKLQNVNNTKASSLLLKIEHNYVYQKDDFKIDTIYVICDNIQSMIAMFEGHFNLTRF